VRRQDNWLRRIRESVYGENPQLSRQPVMEILGKQRILIENHRGVQLYETERIQVCVKFGCIRVLGSGLSLCYMSANQLVITGDIQSVSLESGCG